MTVRHVCPLCEATCGLELTLDGDRVVSVRGDADDVFSKGFVCPKGVAIGDLHHDPARLRAPLVRVDGELREATWDEAFDRIREGLRTVIGESGPNAVALYLGNPNSHNVTSTFYLPALVRALATRYRFSASTVDQMPQQVALGLMYGTELSVPVPDIDRTDLFVVIGGNPLVSNGSLMTVPDMPGRVRALRARGGRMIVVDPVRTRTAAAADEHLAIRPGTDVLLLAAMVNVLFAEGLVTMGAAEPWVRQEEVFRVGELLSAFTPEAVSDPTGLSASAIVTLAREVATAESAAVYGRMGTSTSALNVAGEPTSFGTLASWLIALLNLLTGNLDRPGGVMFPLPPAGGPTTFGEPGRGRGVRIPGSQRTRVRGLPSALGEFPVAALAEEIDTPDPDTGERVRALITVAGNPVVSTPDADRLELALGELDLLICLDAYVTETSRHADVILPAPSPLARDHYDVVFASLAVRNTARWSPAVFPLGETERDEGETLLRLAAIAASVVNGVPEPTVEQMDDLVAFEVARRVGDPAELLRSRPAAGCRDCWITHCAAGPTPTSTSRCSRRLPQALISVRSPRVCRRFYVPRPVASRCSPSRSWMRSRGWLTRCPGSRCPTSRSWAAGSCAPTTRGCERFPGLPAVRAGQRCRSIPTMLNGPASVRRRWLFSRRTAVRWRWSWR